MEEGVSVTLGPLINTQAVNHKPSPQQKLWDGLGQMDTQPANPPFLLLLRSFQEGKNSGWAWANPMEPCPKLMPQRLGLFFPRGKKP